MKRTLVPFLLVLAIFLIFTIKLFREYFAYDSYEKLAFQNVIYTEVDYADRGLIFDRKFRKVIDNSLSYSLVVIPSEVGAATDTGLICEILGIEKQEWLSRIKQLSKKNNPYRESIFEPYLDSAMRFAFQENIMFMQGFFLKKIPLRDYLYPAGFHVFGYTAEVSSKDLEKKPDVYFTNSFVGKNGIERFYDEYMRGKDGKKLWAKNNKNKIVQSYENGKFDVNASEGYSLLSTIDIELQTFAEELMQNKRGAVVAIDPRTGEILCLVSSPNIPPSMIRKDNRQESYASLSSDPNNPLLNRAIQGRYSPGSVFKVIEALIAINNSVIDVNDGYNCHGVYWECKKPVKCEHSNPGHASNLMNAVTYSCNSYFTDLFRKLWNYNTQKHPQTNAINSFRTELNHMGIGRKLAIDLLGETNGFVPDSAYYTRLYGTDFWSSCTLMSLGIGQGELLMSPLQIANAMAILSNRGYFYTPHLVRSIMNKKGGVVKNISVPKTPMDGAKKYAYDIVVDAMKNVVDRGTAAASKIPELSFCGKTGTVENYTIKDGKRIKLNSHSIFAGFAPADTPQICIAVVVENAGFGASVATPIASLVVEKYVKDSISSGRQWWIEHMKNQSFISSQTLKAKP